MLFKLFVWYNIVAIQNMYTYRWHNKKHVQKQSLPVNPSVTLRSEVTIECNILWFMNIILKDVRI